MFGRSFSLYVLPSGEIVGHVLRQCRHHLGAVLALGVLVGEQGGVDVPEHLPPLDRVGQLRVDVVGERGQGDGDLPATSAASAALALLAAGSGSEGGEGNDAGDDQELAQCFHGAPFGRQSGHLNTPTPHRWIWRAIRESRWPDGDCDFVLDEDRKIFAGRRSMMAIFRRMAIVGAATFAPLAWITVLTPGVSNAVECGWGTVLRSRHPIAALLRPRLASAPPPAWNGDITPYFSLVFACRSLFRSLRRYVGASNRFFTVVKFC